MPPTPQCRSSNLSARLTLRSKQLRCCPRILTRPRSQALHAYKNRTKSGSNHYDLGPFRGLAWQLPSDGEKATLGDRDAPYSAIMKLPKCFKRCLRMPKLPCAHLTLLSSGILTRPRSPALHAYKNRSTSGSNHYDLGPDRGLARQLPPDDGKASGTTKPPKPHCRISKPVFLKLASREFKAALPRNSHQYYAVGSACL